MPLIPFLVNPPKRRRKKAKRKHTKRRKTNPARKLVIFNPKRKHKRRKHLKPRRVHRRKIHKKRRINPMARRRKHHRRSNPMKIPFVKNLPLPTLKEIGAFGALNLGTSYIVPRALARLPMLAKNNFVRAASRVALVVVSSMLANMVFKKNPALKKAAVFGAVGSQLTPIINDVMQPTGFKLGLAEDEAEMVELYTENLMLSQDEESSDEGTALYAPENIGSL